MSGGAIPASKYGSSTLIYNATGNIYIRKDLNQDERKEFMNKMEKAQELINKEENNNKFFCGKRLPIKLEYS